MADQSGGLVLSFLIKVDLTQTNIVWLSMSALPNAAYAW